MSLYIDVGGLTDYQLDALWHLLIFSCFLSILRTSYTFF